MTSKLLAALLLILSYPSLGTTTDAVADKPKVEQAAATGESFTLSRHNTVSIVGPIGSATASDFISALTTTKAEQILIYIDSPGGSVLAGNAMITAMKSSGKKTVCIAKFGASMAFGILQACDVRYLTRDGIIMQHSMSYIVAGPAPQNRSLVNLLERIGQKLDMEQADRLGVTYKEFQYKTIRDYWLYSEDAIVDKAADGIAVVTCEESLVKDSVIRTIRGFFGTFKVRMSACPLLLKAETVGENNVPVDLNRLKTTDNIYRLNGITQ